MKTKSNHDRSPATRLAWLAMPFALALVVTGCLARPALTGQSFALQNPAAASAAPARGGGVLDIRPVNVSPLFGTRALVYRTGPDSFEHDPYAGFLVSPDRALTIPIRAYLRDSGAFQTVLESGSLLRPDRILEVHVSELYGDFRTPGQPAAVLTIRFVFFAGGQGAPPGALLDKSYSRRIALPQNTAAAVVAGWDKALAEIMTEVVGDLAAARTATPFDSGGKK